VHRARHWIPPAFAPPPIAISRPEWARISRMRSVSCSVVIEPATIETS
jgi:hypothetical protein